MATAKYIDYLGDLHTEELADTCEPTEHEHDAANYIEGRDGNLVIGTCKHCGEEFIIREIEEEN